MHKFNVVSKEYFHFFLKEYERYSANLNSTRLTNAKTIGSQYSTKFPADPSFSLSAAYLYL